MPSTLSTPKRPRHDWTSLPYDIIGSEAKRFLAGDDIDSYVAFCGTCSDWHKATEDYPEKAVSTDPTHFQPSKWALLHQRDDHVTLVNVDTGRFFCKNISLLHKYIFIGATGGGLILLGELMEPHHACVLNPFTGSIAHFKVPVPVAGVRAVAVTTAPLMVFISIHHGHIMWADQDSECFKRFWCTYSNRPTCMTHFAGQVYAVDQQGSVISAVVDSVTVGEQRPRSAQTISMETIIPSLDTSPDTSHLEPIRTRTYYLVESGGDLLLVRPPWLDRNDPFVHRVDTERKVLKPVSSIGNRAIFAGPVRCLSVEADKFPGIIGGCIYFVMEPEMIRGDYKPPSVMVFHITEGCQDLITFGCATPEGCFRPLTLVQDLADYCRYIHYSELFEINAREWALDLSSDSDESSYSETDDEGSYSETDDEASSSKCEV
ncbi:unnamed protein product [Urochloa decumbens]|uniref:KIB1-4 beta-propeller domain-containing protein n=1 Tax=Urochloa decumbens TaxID=240449 RepID=A0ABC9F010_9POAL